MSPKTNKTSSKAPAERSKKQDLLIQKKMDALLKSRQLQAELAAQRVQLTRLDRELFRLGLGDVVPACW